MESGIEFVAADMPFANKLTIHILAAVAEHEREAISARTKAALAAAKARGAKLGGPKLKQAQRRGIASNKAKADRFAANVRPVIEQIKASGATSLPIAKAFNARGVPQRLVAGSGRQCKSPLCCGGRPVLIRPFLGSAERADGRTKHRGDDPEMLDGLAKAIDNGHAWKSLGDYMARRTARKMKRAAAKKTATRRLAQRYEVPTGSLKGREARAEERFRELAAWYVLQGMDEATARQLAQDEIDNDTRKD